MDALNLFIKGISSDLDYQNRQGDTWDFPTLNARVFNKEGQGLIITNMNGNSEEFQLSSGFIAHGSCQYEGILYILSHNATTGEGELGCFPSPSPWIDNTQGSFSRIYRPLWNFVESVFPFDRQPFRTTAFNLSLEHQSEMFARFDYDDSLNLYICDYNNPNRVINTGFTTSGFITARTYDVNDMGTNINQIQTVGQTLGVELVSIDNGGSFAFGNYFFYFRYLTASLDATAFIAESNACQMYAGNIDTMSDVQGGFNSSTANSGKLVNFHLTNVDTTYQYIEVAYIRFFGDGTMVELSEVKLIDQQFTISGDTLDIQLTGSTTNIPLDDSTIVTPKIPQTTCKSHCQIDNRYFGANWKGMTVANDILAEFALQWGVSYHIDEIDGSGFKGHEDYDIIPDYPGSIGSYKDYYKTYEEVGYFGGEPYCFKMVFELIDGSYSQAFGMIGVDSLNNLLPSYNTALTNVNGIYRFPSRTIDPSIVTLGTSQMLRILKAKIFILNPGTYTVDSWITNNVKNFFIVRAERDINHRTLEAQGIIFNMVKPYEDNVTADSLKLTLLTTFVSGITTDYDYLYGPRQDGTTAHIIGEHPVGQPSVDLTGVFEYDHLWGYDGADPVNWNNGTETYDGGLIPSISGYMPMGQTHGGSTNGEYKKYKNYCTRWILEPKKYSFWSFDVLLSRDYDPMSVKSIDTIAVVGKPNGCLETGWPAGWDFQAGCEIIKSTDTVGTDPVITYHDIMPCWYFLDVRDYNLPTGLATKHCKPIGNGIKTIGFPNTSTVLAPTLIGSTPFINQTFDRWTDDTETLWHARKDPALGTDRQWSIRSMYFPKYLGIETDENKSTLNGNIVNLYNVDDINSVDITVFYADHLNLLYYRVSEKISIDSVANIICGGGDCFLQRAYFKPVYWGCTSLRLDGMTAPYNCCIGGDDCDAWDSSNSAFPMRNTHGILMGIVTENYFNVGMRHHGLDNEYYPNFVDKWTFALKGTEQVDGSGIEAFLYNVGYHRTLGLQSHVSYDANIPQPSNKKITRIRHSEVNIPHSVTDGYKILDQNAYVDYDLGNGQINKIGSFGNRLVSVQESSISSHIVNEQFATADLTSGSVGFGPGPVLAKQVNKLANFGSQHQWSVLFSEDSICGVDWKRRIIWGVGSSTTTSGAQTMAATDYVISKSIDRWFEDLQDSISLRSDIMDEYPDNPIQGEGIVIGCDYKYKEILLTFLWGKSVYSIDEEKLYIVYSGKTIMYSELGQFFVGETSFTPSMYLNINRDMFSTQKDAQKVYLHNNPVYFSKFYDVEYPFKLSFIVNASGSQGSPLMQKMYKAMELGSSETDFDSITYETQYQTSVHTPFVNPNKPWINPRYQEHKWMFPVNVQTSVDSGAFKTNSDMRGAWMKVTLQFTGNEPLWIKYALTRYITSYV